MQNRYVADIGDYVKFAILRALAHEPRERRVGVAWWLFPDENHKADGGHREYLQRPDKWKQFDPSLFESLVTIDHEKRLNVRALEEASLLPNAVFAPDPVPCDLPPLERASERVRWLAAIKTRLRSCDLVFLDPDNGIASEKMRLTHRRAWKSVTIEDISTLAQSNRTMVIYHHQTRRKGGHISELHNLAERLRRSGLKVSGALRAKPWSPRAFFILNGDGELHYRAKKISETWSELISWHPDI